ncbi:DUF4149 domain-containing protein [Polynucleobacter sp. MWH-Spelu-300-X4]|nr:DUF4149 domain-containing protein [Polynucleobacter sp. MWH-Spelu-300-X4]
MHTTAQRVFVYIFALWLGSLVTIGYVVAPVLFATLHDTQVAGMIAGQLFRIEGTISLVLGVALIVFANLLVKRGLVHYKQVRWYLLAMLIGAAIVAFILQPMMNAMREEALAQGFPVMLSPLAASFGRLHGVSSVLYLIQTLLGLVLMWRLTKSVDLVKAD